ncbi:MAG TPA: class I SAM-dependent methyltransferase [Candidatus Binatia bacterium]|nr:class I SAM-dependent methyltransferase [Candidatus Binatia bacterium]
MPVELTFNLLISAVAAISAYLCVQSDVRRRRLPGSTVKSVLWIGVAALVTAVLCRLLVPFGSRLMLQLAAAVVVGCLAVALAARHRGVPPAVLFDIVATATVLAFAAGMLVHLLIAGAISARSNLRPEASFLSLWSSEIRLIESVAGFLIFWFLWREGRAAMQWQRPNGLVTGEFLVLSGTVLLGAHWLRYPTGFRLGTVGLASLAGIAAGLVVIAVTLAGYFRHKEEHRILDHVDAWGETVQPEYTPPTPECPHPQRWSMYDSMTAEVETLDFLKSLVTTMKPRLVVETGSFAGMSTLAMAEGMAQNGFGKIVTCELDERVFSKARERIDSSGLGKWVEYRNRSSLDMTVEGTIDMLFSDSEQSIREQEVRRFLPQMSPHGLILIHDAASCYDFVRKAALRMEAEGLISVVLMPTARGLVIAQKRDGRR